MKSIFTFLFVLALFSSISAQTECIVKVVYSMNKSQPLSYTFTTDPVITDAQFEWLFGDQSTYVLPTPTHVFKATGLSYVKVKVIKGDKICYGKLEARFEGGTPTPAPAILSGKGKVKMPGSGDGCRLLIYLDNGTVLAPVQIIPAFEFKDGQYIELAYELQKENLSGCTTGVSAKIHKIALINVPAVCKVPVTFKKNEGKPGSYTFSTTEQPAGSQYLWYFGDGGKSELAAPTYVFKKAGTWVVNLKIVDKNGKMCYGEIKETFEGVTVVTTPVIVSGKGKVKMPGSGDGCRLLIYLDNGTVLAPVQTIPAFEFKDGQYVELAYELQKENISGCTTGVSAKIHKIALINVPAVCKVPVTIKKNEDKPGSYTFSTTEQPAGSIYLWYFGDGGKSELAAPTYVFKKAGNWVVNLKIVDKNGKMCYGEIKETFAGETNPPLAARGKVKKLAVTGCDLVIALDNAILIPAKLPADFNLVEGQYVEFTYEKLAEKITTCKEGIEVKILTIKVIQTTPECKAYFTATNKIWSDPAMMKKVAFSNLSVGDIAELTWDFGDKTTVKNEPKPTHVYAAFGTYKVCLSILTKTGCKSEYCAEVKVDSLAPSCKFDIVVKPKEASPKTFLFNTVSPAEIKTWKWSFGDGKESDLKNPEHTYEKPGIYEVTCVVKTAAGCTEKRVIRQTVLAAPLATCKGAISLLLFDATDKCNGKATVKLVDENAKEVSGVKYLWPDGRTGSTVENLCPDKPYTVQAIIEGVCQKSTSFTMMSKPVWNVTNTNGQNKYSVADPKEGVQYEWSFGNGVFLKGAEVNYDFKTDGVFDVTLKAISGNTFSEYSQKVEVLKSVTSVEKIEKPELDVYPNPVKDVLKIKFGNPVEGALQIEIMNIAGQPAFSKQLPAGGITQSEVDVRHLKPGIYFLRLMNGTNRIADRKFIKAE